MPRLRGTDPAHPGRVGETCGLTPKQAPIRRLIGMFRAFEESAAPARAADSPCPRVDGHGPQLPDATRRGDPFDPHLRASL